MAGNALTRVADRHVEAMSLVVLGAVKASRDEVTADEEALARGDLGAVLASLEPAFAALAAALGGADRDEKAPSEPAATLQTETGATLTDAAQASELCVPRTAWPGRVSAGPGVDPKVLAKVRRQLDDLPLAVRSAVADTVPIRVVGTPLPNRPTASGTFSAEEMRIFLRVKPKAKYRIEQVARHEVFHAYDTLTSLPSEAAAFREAFATDLQTFGRRPGDVFVEHYALNVREAFAQSAAHLTGPIANRAEFVKAFPRTIAETRRVLTSRGVLSSTGAAS